MIKLKMWQLKLLEFHLTRPAGMADRLACVRGVIQDDSIARVDAINHAVPMLARDLAEDQERAFYND